MQAQLKLVKMVVELIMLVGLGIMLMFAVVCIIKLIHSLRGNGAGKGMFLIALLAITPMIEKPHEGPPQEKPGPPSIEQPTPHDPDVCDPQPLPNRCRQ